MHKNRVRPIFLQFFSAFLLPILINCSPSGPGNDGGIITIVGCMYEENGKPASDATVALRPTDYLPQIGDLKKHNSFDTSVVFSTNTDSDGKFQFNLDSSDITPDGNYIIGGSSSNKDRSVFINNITIDKSAVGSIEIDTPYHYTTLKPPGSISGTIHLEGDSTRCTGGVVMVYGLDEYAIINADGSFFLKNIPEGTFKLKLIVQQDSLTCEGTLIAISKANVTTSLGSLYQVLYLDKSSSPVQMPTGGKTYRTGDTLIVLGDSTALSYSGHAFTGWNTSVDGSGDTCLAGDTIIVDSSSVILYPQWKIIKVYLKVMTNGYGQVTGTDSVFPGSTNSITATADADNPFIKWRVIEGTAAIADSTAPATLITLQDSNVVVSAIFQNIRFWIQIDNDSDETVTGACLTTDNNYLITGSIVTNATNCNFYILKMDPNGKILWKKNIEDSSCANEDYSIYNIQQTSDDNLTIIGYNYSSFAETNNYIFFMRTDADGNKIWTKSYSGYTGSACAETNDGGFIVTGYDYPEDSVFLLKTDSNGDTIWTRKYGGNSLSIVNSVVQTTDGGYFVTGLGASDSSYLFKTDPSGELLWLKGYREYDGYGYSVIQTTDGNYIFAGRSSDYSVISKTDQSGKQIWVKRYPNSSCDYDPSDHYGVYVRQTSDEGYLVTTGCNLYKTDVNGDSLWTRNYKIIGTFGLQTKDDGYFIAGNDSENNIILIKTDEFGNFH